jgi:N-acetyl-anhydromuramyl-L-alanine amidase AmpD
MDIIESKFDVDYSDVDKKTQIILIHTSRPLIDFMVSLKHRFLGKPPRLPHYLISRDGKILQTLDDNMNSNYFNSVTINYKSIVISLENLGWLEKVPLRKYHINWIGNIYKDKVVEKKWRDNYFWQPYTEVQYEKTAELCRELSKKHNINLNFVGHNTKIKGIETFMGIITRANFDSNVTDLSPAFDFEKFNKLLKNE